MSMFRANAARTLLLGLFFALSGLLISRPAAAATNGNMENPEVRGLLNQATQQANRLDYDADQMSGLLENDVNWREHATMLTQVKEHVNALGQILAKLQGERSQGNIWQQRAIDRMVPLLREIADNTTDAINHVNKNQNRPVSGHYADYLEANADTSHELARLVQATADYAHSGGRLGNLKQQIDMATK